MIRRRRSKDELVDEEKLHTWLSPFRTHEHQETAMIFVNLPTKNAILDGCSTVVVL